MTSAVCLLTPATALARAFASRTNTGTGTGTGLRQTLLVAGYSFRSATNQTLVPQQRRGAHSNYDRSRPERPPRGHGPPRPGPPRPHYGQPRGPSGGGPRPYGPRPTGYRGQDSSGEHPAHFQRPNTTFGLQNSRAAAATPLVKPKMARMPRNNAITFSHVLLPQEDGTLGLPERTEDVLQRIDRRNNALVVVAMPQSNNDEYDNGFLQPEGERRAALAEAMRRFPVCRIVDTKAERQAADEERLAARKKKVGKKELEINWAIDLHNLGFRLVKLREFLDKGLYVEIRLMFKSAKSGKRRATLEEAEEVLRRIRATIDEVPGTVETKPTEGVILRMMKLFLKGPDPTKKAKTKGEQ
ncbi:translation initiation factor [Sporothrix brasiliensis 5110]|uniref:Translation initiation factor n=1 Tax=Sporothrix brasiliensis 5110 TaxID=1398154 RepID=A0A0C2F5A7_9PEZI|nr:translation initiation factor [Sporothrix brasiliensis 5110]KIH94094.1 translation initiation factor [Sporothrix brasiliensis 5110]